MNYGTSPIYDKIVLNNFLREKHSLSKNACFSNSGERINPDMEKIPDRSNIRPTFFHDTDRIIHSKSYSRYIDKTQVFYLFENDHITHRVLHVQFVSKIARVIGRCLKLNEDLIEAISLGHDLGHVPYGHDGEGILNNLCKEYKIGYFCHNAQSVRFLMEIENKGNGLNLTTQVLDGILAHNGEIVNREYKPEFTKTKKKFLEEYESCFKIEDYSKWIAPMTLEGCVVRISDVIAYIGRDIEDAIILNVIKRDEIPESINKVLGNSNPEIINKLVMDLIKNSFGADRLIFSEDIFKALFDLKNFNTENIYKNQKIKTQLIKISNIFSCLFDKYKTEIENHNIDSSIFTDFLSEMGSDYQNSNSNERKIVDYIAGMTDDYLNNQFKKYFVPESFGYAL